MRYQPDAYVAESVTAGQAGLELRVLLRGRGSRVVDVQWCQYQNRLLADCKYTFEELYPNDAQCLFEMWRDAHEEDRVRSINNQEISEWARKNGAPAVVPPLP